MIPLWERATHRWRSLCGWLDQWLYQRPIVLCYHRIGTESIDPFALSVSPNHFSDHLGMLRKSGRRIVPLSQIWKDGDLVPRTVAVTFDDGYADNLHSAKPILDRYDVPATFFLPTGHIGSNEEFWWDELDRILDCESLPARCELEDSQGRMFSWKADGGPSDTGDHRMWRAWQPPQSDAQRLYGRLYEYLRPLPSPDRMKQMSILRKLAGWSTRNRAARRTLTWNEVDELFTSSQMRAGGHTVNHSDLAVISETDQKFEIETDKQILEERTAKQVREFAYPYGSYATKSAATSTILRQAGFDLAFTTSVGGVRRSGDPFLLPRFPVRNWNGDEFSRRLALC